MSYKNIITNVENLDLDEIKTNEECHKFYNLIIYAYDHQKMNFLYSQLEMKWAEYNSNNKNQMSPLIVILGYVDEFALKYMNKDYNIFKRSYNDLEDKCRTKNLIQFDM